MIEAEEFMFLVEGLKDLSPMLEQASLAMNTKFAKLTRQGSRYRRAMTKAEEFWDSPTKSFLGATDTAKHTGVKKKKDGRSQLSSRNFNFGTLSRYFFTGKIPKAAVIFQIFRTKKNLKMSNKA